MVIGNITEADHKQSNTIFGPNLPGIRGSTVQKKPEWVEPEYVDVPRAIVDMNQLVTLTAEVKFVNQVPFLITLSWQVGCPVE